MNNFAISSGGIGEALERSASSLMAANNTIDESIALITAANTVVGFVPPNIVIYWLSERIEVAQNGGTPEKDNTVGKAHIYENPVTTTA